VADNVLDGRYFDSVSNKHINKKYSIRKILVTSILQIVKANGRTALLSNQFSDILAAAGLRAYQPHHHSQGKERGSRRGCQRAYLSQSASYLHELAP
jgi:hypothetical protein